MPGKHDLEAPGSVALATFEADGITDATDSISIGIPYLDIPTGTILYRTQSYTLFSNQDNPGATTMADQVKEQLWTQVLSDPRWQYALDPTRQQTFEAVQGLNPPFTDPGVQYIGGISVLIGDVGKGVNEWFPNGAFAKFGYVTFGDTLVGIQQLGWINSRIQSFTLSQGAYSSSVQIYLLPGCTATVTITGRLFPKPLVISGVQHFPPDSDRGFPY